MKYLVEFTLQREVSVVVDVNDNEINSEFERLGEIQNDKDFVDEFDLRWEIEQTGYDKLSSCEIYKESEFDMIVSRKIIKHWTTMDKEQIENLMTFDKVDALITALEIIANGNPVKVGLDEIIKVAQNALDYFEHEIDLPVYR